MEKKKSVQTVSKRVKWATYMRIECIDENHTVE